MLFIAEQLAGRNPSLRDEVRLVVGPPSREGVQVLPTGQNIPNGVLGFGSPGVGGFAPPGRRGRQRLPPGETSPRTRSVTLPASPTSIFAERPGVPASSLPNNANVVAIGWDMWNNVPVRAAIDLMSYCWAQAWMSPECWRRIFLEDGTLNTEAQWTTYTSQGR